jgi:L-lactate dehydrogenase complex protein LldG
MQNSSSKENILKKIRQALSNPVPVPFPKSEGNSSLFQKPVEELDITFASEFTKLQGKFAFCFDEKDFKAQLKQLFTERQWKNIYCVENLLRNIITPLSTEKLNQTTLKDCDVAVTSCEYLIARTGSIVLSSAMAEGRTASVYAPVHICVAYTNQLVYDVKDGLQKLKEKHAEELPSLISFATGPSRTADIEKTLVVGVHGPKEVYLFLIDNAM